MRLTAARLVNALFAAVLVVLLSGCDHKELCLHHDHTVRLRVAFDWRDAPEANPEGMVVFFYPEDPDGHYYRFDFRGTEGGYVDVARGHYKMLTYNNDTYALNFLDINTHDLHQAVTRDANVLEPMGSRAGQNIPRAPGSEDERVVLCPDEIWGCNALDVEVTDLGVSYVCNPFDSSADGEPYTGQTTTEHVITLFPHPMTCVYTYEIRNVRNINLIESMSASLSGMSPSLFLFSETLHPEPVTLPFEAMKSEDGRIVGRFITFGHHEDNPQSHRMMLYIRTYDGRQFSFGSQSDKFDVTDQVHSAPDRRRVHLIIDGIDVPTPVDPPGSLQPAVDDWPEVNIDIPI